MMELIWLEVNRTKLWGGIGPYQQGFRKGGNTHVQITRLLHRIEKNEVKALVFIDLKGAYDTVNKQKLLDIVSGRINDTYSTNRLKTLLDPIDT